MPSAEVGGDVRRNHALNCWPWVRSLIHSPDAVAPSWARRPSLLFVPTRARGKSCRLKQIGLLLILFRWEKAEDPGAHRPALGGRVG
jgi:hypothetical protein